MTTHMFYGWELTIWKRKYENSKEFNEAVNELGKEFHVIIDETYNLMFAAVNHETVEDNEVGSCSLDDLIAIAARASELRAAIETHLGKWVTLTLEPEFFAMQES